MTNELVWENVKKYIPEDKINEFHQVQTMIKNNPADAVGYLNFLFITLSIQRMKQLALKTNNEEINESYFESTTIKIAWELLKYKFNISSEEYKYVVDFCTLSDKKANSITEQDANKAMDLLLMVAEKLELPNYSSLNEVEIAITKDEGSQEVISSNNSVKDSKFVSMLEVLQSSSKESVANADSFGKLQSYMHVDRGIQKEFEEILKELKQKERPGLLLLCDSVGDGKSHLLAYMKAKHSDLFEGVFIHNDSTESYDYDKNSLETLEKVLSQFDMNGTASRPVIIAINLGVLHNFYSKQRKLDKFQSLCDFIDRCGVFDRGQQGSNHDGDFHLLNFADTQPYVLTEDGTESSFFMELIDKVTAPNPNNPFYDAWIQDMENEITSAAHTNYSLLQQQEVKESIVQSLIEVMIKKKVFISTRAFYNFLFEVIVPINYELAYENEEMSVNEMLPNLMYGHPDRSPLLAALHEIDPLKNRLETTDKLVANLMLKTDSLEYVKEELGEKTSIGAWKQVNNMHKQRSQTEFSQLFIRHHSLLYRKNYDEAYREFVKFLYSYYIGDEEETGRLFELIENVIFAWKGSPKDRYVYADSPNKTFRVAFEIIIDPEVDDKVFGSANNVDNVERFTSSMRIGFSQRGKTFLFELDYQLFSLLKQINKGYRPNRQDIQNALQFSEFHHKLIQSAEKKNNVLIVHTHDGTIIEVKKPRFSKSKFEVGKVN